MATCGHCKATGQTVDHVRTCGQVGGAVATKQLPTLVAGNVVTLAGEDGYWLVTHVYIGGHIFNVERICANGAGTRGEAFVETVEMVFTNTNAATDYRLAQETEVLKRRNREILHGDPNYCRACARGLKGRALHREGCPNTPVAQPLANNHHAFGATLREPAGGEAKWGTVNNLRNQVKPHLHRKVRNAMVGHFALRAPQDEGGMVKFYRVKLVTGGNWTGKVFVDAQASDEFWPVRNPDALAWILAGILIDPRAAETLYGTELGQCYRCNRTLTDETSRALGIGPECRSKL